MKQDSSENRESKRRGAGQVEWVAGVDLGDRSSQCCVVDRAGEVVRQGRLRTSREELTAWFGQQRAMRVVIEVGTHSAWVSRLLSELGHEVVVDNARQVRLIYEDYGKSDRRDAETLARLGRLDRKLLKPIQHRGPQAQVCVSSLRARQAVIGSRTKLIHSARGLVKAFGYRLPACSAESFPRRVRDQVPPELQPILLPLLVQVVQLTRTIRVYDRLLEQVARRYYPETERLEQASGVGVLTALAYVVTLEDPARFAKSRQVGPYLGLTPRRDQSGERDPQLGITKAGNGYLRQLLVNSAHYMLGPLCQQDSDLRRWGRKFAERGGKNAKKRAVVAVARRLAVLLHHLWVSGEVYEPQRSSAAPVTAAAGD